jgi:hypothetical protein
MPLIPGSDVLLLAHLPETVPSCHLLFSLPVVFSIDVATSPYAILNSRCLRRGSRYD